MRKGCICGMSVHCSRYDLYEVRLSEVAAGKLQQLLLMKPLLWLQSLMVLQHCA